MPLNYRLLARGALLILVLPIFTQIAGYLYEAVAKPCGISLLGQPESHDWEAAYSGWYNRSAIIEDTTNIHLKASDLILSSTSSAWGHTSFYLALFKPDICIMNHAALRMNRTDLTGIEHLALEASKIDQTFYNMMPGIFDVETDTLRLFEDGQRMKQYQAYAFSEDDSCKNSEKMPKILCQLFRSVRDYPGNLKTGEDDEDFKRLMEDVQTMIEGVD